MSQEGFWRVLAFAALLCGQGECARILGIFTTPATSHLIIHTAITDALAARGHNVTLITTIPLVKPNPLYRHIHLSGWQGVTKDFLVDTIKHSRPYHEQFVYLTKMVNHRNNASLNDPAVKRLMAEEQFDLVIIGYFYNDFQLGVAAHFKCPVVLSFMIQSFTHLHQLVGNPLELSYVPSVFTHDKQPLTFLGRVNTFLMTIFEMIMIRLYMTDQQKELYNYNFPPDKYPSLEEMQKNISLVFSNHHFTQGPIRPNVPGMVEIGGIQVKDKPDPLPEDIKSVLDNAKNGIIYFSFGSNVQGTLLDKEKGKIMFDVLSKLPQTVLWKWGDSHFPGQSPNIVYKSWVPQDDVLAHPNVKLFVTHGGQGSVVESEYHGVPMVGVPLFAEQRVNMADVEFGGYGVKVDYPTMTVESFGAAVHEVLSNPRYRENVQRFAKLYKDRPMTARETVIYWTEYVLRHRGAPHMQSPAVHLNQLQLMSLDVLAFLLAVIYLVYKVIRLSCSAVCSRCSSKRKSKRE